MMACRDVDTKLSIVCRWQPKRRGWGVGSADLNRRNTFQCLEKIN